ncbi:hypothetical protein A3747_06590 [Sulfitobacter sp. HI0076]|jgi:sodium/bile acid cotransporter 7|nr:hypothetical protein A3720_03920 [Sulfitobacter sp. HI0021]KZX95548.1 hypothetical protein A3722_17755 [Sulfitobacter sp. HI0027]KZY99781.1 hypothetical protein A3747_06590 [Sulfitobacter sp. HI0076]
MWILSKGGCEPFAAYLFQALWVLRAESRHPLLMVLTGRLFGLDAGDRAALFYCGSTKSLASGLPIATALFAAEAVGAIVLPLMIYHMLQLLVCAFLAQKAVVAPAA